MKYWFAAYISFMTFISCSFFSCIWYTWHSTWKTQKNQTLLKTKQKYNTRIALSVWRTGGFLHIPTLISHTIKIHSLQGTWTQFLNFEGLPLRYFWCNMIGHKILGCSTKLGSHDKDFLWWNHRFFVKQPSPPISQSLDVDERKAPLLMPQTRSQNAIEVSSRAYQVDDDEEDFQFNMEKIFVKHLLKS